MTDKKRLTAREKARIVLDVMRDVRTVCEIEQEYGVDQAQIRQLERDLIDKAHLLFRDDVLPAPLMEISGSRLASHELQSRQVQANEALVLKILECQRVEEALVESRKSLRQLVAHQEQIKEEERKRIAREIHDDLGQNLLVLRMDISRMYVRTIHENPYLHDWTTVMLANIDVTIKSVRALINDLRPFELDLGLHAAAEAMLKRFARSNGIEYTLSSNESTRAVELDDRQLLAIFRILQESLSNIARHSRATRLAIDMKWSDAAFSMRIADNGVGFFQDRGRSASAFGLVAINERVSLLGGEVTIDGSSGAGTVISVYLPLGMEKCSLARGSAR